MGLPESHRRLVRTLARTMFTRDRAPELDGDDVDVVGRVDAWLEILDPGQRGIVLGALTSFDAAYGVYMGTPGRRFQEGTFAERTAFLQASVESQNFLRRQVVEVIRIVLLTSYVDAPAICEAVGVEDQVSLARARVAAARALKPQVTE